MSFSAIGDGDGAHLAWELFPQGGLQIVLIEPQKEVQGSSPTVFRPRGQKGVPKPREFFPVFLKKSIKGVKS